MRRTHPMELDDDDDEDLSVRVRPYSADFTSTGISQSLEQERGRQPFKPVPPQQRKTVEKSQNASVDDVQAYLDEGLRRQDRRTASGEAQRAIPERFQGMSLHKWGLDAAPTSLGAAAGSLAPKKKKEWTAGKSLDLADLAFASVRTGADGIKREMYTPISLPYYNLTEDDDKAAAAAGGKAGSRPSLLNVDEDNSNAAKEIFFNRDGTMKEDQFMLLQLPPMLPNLVDPSQEEKPTDEEVASGSARAGITKLPDGLIGKLKIHKSGKVRMEIGGLPFVVDKGSETYFQQDLACVCPLNKDFVNLGPITDRVVVTPDIAAMLDGISLEREKAPVADNAASESRSTAAAIASASKVAAAVGRNA